MKAREVIAEVLDHCDECPDSGDVLNALRIAGFVILPKEPSKETLLKGLEACCLHFYAHNSAPLVGISDRDIRAAYRAMISYAEGEKG